MSPGNLIDDTSDVSAFYDQFPFPPDSLKDEPPLGFNWRWSFENVSSFCTGALPFPKNRLKKISILDAGCGSGVSTDYLAHLNHGSDILAIDISSISLNIAKERLARSFGDRQANLRFENISLFDVDREVPYDFINSVGVLHHLKDPLAGLKALGSLLKDGGILHLFIYADLGRFEIKQVHKALACLGIFQEDNALELGRKLIDELPSNNPLKKNYIDKWSVECQSDVNFADMYLHPRETTFNLSRLWELIDKSKLEFLGFSNPMTWSLERLLDGELLERAKKMSLIKQMELVEALDPDIGHFEFFLSKGKLGKYEWDDDDLLLSKIGKINSCLWGWPSKTLHDSDLNRIEIDEQSFRLLKAIEKFPETPFELLPLSWDKSMIASTARDLHRRQLLLLYPS